MADKKDLTPQEQQEDARRRQQANLFLGALLIVIGFAAGNAVSIALSDRWFIVGGLAVGIIGAWLVSKYAK